MNWDEIKTELRKPLDPSAIKPPPQGKFGEYVDGLHVIREANRIFGEDGWSYEVTRLQMVSEQTVTLKGRDGEYDQYRVGYLCAVKVNVGGVIREGCAVGNGAGNPNSMADQHESAVKEAETDALKRALRCFGNTFGLALYEKDKSKREVGDPNPPRPEELRDRIKATLTKLDNPATLEKFWRQDKTNAAMRDLPVPMQGELQKVYTDRMGQLAS